MRSALACRSLSSGEPDLLRYWTAFAPPAIAAATREVSSSVSEVSGVSAYKPEIGARTRVCRSSTTLKV